MPRSSALSRPAADDRTAARRSARLDADIAAAVDLLGRGAVDPAMRRIDVVRPGSATAAQATMLGLIHAATGDNRRALTFFERALALQPGQPTALLHRANALAALGDSPAAIAAFAAAVAAGSADPDAHLAHGHLLRQAGRLDEAIAAYDAALALRPADPEALRAGGQVLRDLGHVEAALRFFAEAIRLRPDDLGALLDRTALLHSQERFAEALANDEAGLAVRPGDAALLNNKGIALQELGDLQAACDCYLAAAAADPALAPAHLNGGNALVWLGRPEAALAAFERALRLRPHYPAAHCGRGLTLKMLGRFEAALAAFETALAQDPGFPHALANRGELHLLLGHLGRGWADYELRFLAGRQVKPCLVQPVPQWTGQPVRGLRVAVLADQGRGDVFHFARYLPLLVAAGADVTFGCPARLHRVLRALTTGLRVVETIGEHEDFDLQVALSSLPFAFATTADTIPVAQAYLSAEPALVEHWAARLGQGGFRIGLCWRGSQSWQADPKRSIPLEAFAPLAALPGVRLLSLQMPDNAEAGAGTVEAFRIDTIGAELDRGPDSFVDTAALMASLDLVVTCDTSIAHLAGALGRPTWVLLQAVPEWRWLLGTETSPWYPSLRLFRQTAAGAWDVPISRLVEALAARIATACPPEPARV